jgi:hypothetical protein
MTPQPKTKTSEISSALWQIFISGEALNIFNRNSFCHEIDSLKKVDPDGFHILSAILAAIEGNIKETLNLAGIAMEQCDNVPTLTNWSNLLLHLGQIRESFQFIKKSSGLAPGDTRVVELLIPLSAAIEETETLEFALETWHKLNPGKIYPLAAAYLLNQQNTPDGVLDDESILRVLDSMCVEKNVIAVRPSDRLEALARTLMQEIDE